MDTAILLVYDMLDKARKEGDWHTAEVLLEVIRVLEDNND